MLLNLLSRSTPGGSRSDDQSIPCLLYPNSFHRTSAQLSCNEKGKVKNEHVA